MKKAKAVLIKMIGINSGMTHHDSKGPEII